MFIHNLSSKSSCIGKVYLLAVTNILKDLAVTIQYGLLDVAAASLTSELVKEILYDAHHAVDSLAFAALPELFHGSETDVDEIRQVVVGQLLDAVRTQFD